MMKELKKLFKFIDPGNLRDGDLELILTGKHPEDPAKKYSPYYEFEMRRTTTLQCMGVIRLRIGSARVLRYPGHGDAGPTLEIFQYSRNEAKPDPSGNREGLNHLAFEVCDADAHRGALPAARRRSRTYNKRQAIC